jgi:hypothetical protein
LTPCLLRLRHVSRSTYFAACPPRPIEPGLGPRALRSLVSPARSGGPQSEATSPCGFRAPPHP